MMTANEPQFSEHEAKFAENLNYCQNGKQYFI